jgi:hypothetical protein
MKTMVSLAMLCLLMACTNDNQPTDEQYIAEATAVLAKKVSLTGDLVVQNVEVYSRHNGKTVSICGEYSSRELASDAGNFRRFIFTQSHSNKKVKEPVSQWQAIIADGQNSEIDFGHADKQYCTN